MHAARLRTNELVMHAHGKSRQRRQTQREEVIDPVPLVYLYLLVYIFSHTLFALIGSSLDDALSHPLNAGF